MVYSIRNGLLLDFWADSFGFGVDMVELEADLGELVVELPG